MLAVACGKRDADIKAQGRSFVKRASPGRDARDTQVGMRTMAALFDDRNACLRQLALDRVQLAGFRSRIAGAVQHERRNHQCPELAIEEIAGRCRARESRCGSRRKRHVTTV
ncbi:MAG: hypothetical protein H0T89_21265 [Deltaproteobacteria bacterium]|nr:hypothetical protein [Deltaproteobacteria bacterium]MDQ3301175.1 hypothetical protein [Myxococcota bacterium]